MLHIKLQSFSYKKGLPMDETEHGGGFVFDCRFIDNPGRLEQYKYLTGKDVAVKNFLEQKTDMITYLNSVEIIIKNVIYKYQYRNFTYLSIAFGCTGGQHRSVYAAESIAHYIQRHFRDVDISLIHREL